MKRVSMFLLVLALFVIASCNNVSDFESAIKDGKEAIVNEEYDKAFGSFESALALKSDDEEAQILVSQTGKMIEAINEQEDGNIRSAIALFEEVVDIENGYDKLSEQAGERKKLLQQEEQDKYDKQLKEAEELINNEEYDAAKELLHTIISETEDVEHLEEQYEKATEILSEIGEDHAAVSSSNTLSDKVFIDHATEEFLGKFDSYSEFTDGNNESVVFWSEKPISNFKFIEIGYEMDGSDFSYFQNGVLYSIDRLLPEKPVVINTIISEGIPNRGISYRDGSGNERYFYITWSGVDDSLLLTEFENKEPSGSSSNSSATDLSVERSDRVLDATLQILSADGYTTVDFAKRTAFRDGKEMIFEIVSIPNEGHTEFQEGLIREKIDEIQSHTLYSFEFDDNNKLTLIDPATLEAVYAE